MREQSEGSREGLNEHDVDLLQLAADEAYASNDWDALEAANAAIRASWIAEPPTGHPSAGVKVNRRARRPPWRRFKRT